LEKEKFSTNWESQIIKTFIIAQFLYTLSAIKMPEDCITKLETVILNFIWSGGRPKLKSSILKQTSLAATMIRWCEGVRE
jgi:hypothetical protein